MSIASDFKKFALRGNLIDLAIGFTVGAAFTTIARSLVDDVIMPPVGLLLGRSDFSDFFLVLREGARASAPYATLAEAQSAGAVTINYGVFGNAVIAFLVVTFAMFVVMRLVNRADEALEEHFGEAPAPGEPTSKKCPFCRQTIAFRATRCPACTSHLEPAAGPGPAPA